ncbi:MAG: hypothetical protein ABEI58_02130 [Candidatus Nanohaloarchaea archaeon]
MGWLKWIVIIGISFFFPPFLIIFLLWKYIKLMIRVDLYIMYLMIRIPLWLFIQLPLFYLFSAGHAITGFFIRGLTAIEHHKKTSIFFGGLYAAIAFLLFRPTSLSAGEIGAKSTVFVFFMVAGGFFGIIIASLIAKYRGLDFQLASKSFRGKGPKEKTKEKATEKAQKAKETGIQGRDLAAAGMGVAATGVSHGSTAHQAYQTVKEGEVVGEAGSIPTDILAILEDLPVVGEAVAGLGSASILPAILAILVIILALLVVLIVQAVVVAALFGGFIYAYLPMVLGPVAGAVGLGAAYGNLAGQTVGNKYLAGIDFSEEKRALQEAGARVNCVLKGPSCLRQWRLNNTVRPGSEDVGETYGLKIDRFEIGQGKTVNIAFKEKNYPLPISFTISNPRHGLKGINARNVKYRLKMIDMDHQGENAFCDTGWIPVGAGGGAAYNVDNDGKKDDIYPGTSASTGFLTIRAEEDGGQAPGDGFTLEDCNMLQPALGEYRTVMLEVRYDYFSQATLYFQAMSRENLQSNPSIQKRWEESKTADTPVKAAVNVNAPVLFYQSPDNGLQAQPFGVRATVNTDKYDIRYKVKDLTITKSSRTTRVEGAGQECQFESIAGKDDKFRLEDEAKSNIISSAIRSKVEENVDSGSIENYLWFTKDRQPPLFGCVMKLNQLSSISQAGETLNMNIKANYTVAKSEKIDNFKVHNSRCSNVNCPLLVTRQFAQSDRDYGWQTKCKGVDAGNGCTIVKGEGDWTKIQPTNSKFDASITQGEIALEVEALDALDGVDDVDGTSGETKLSAALKERNWKKVDEDETNYAIVWKTGFDGKPDTKYRKVNVANLCTQESVSASIENERGKWRSQAKDYLRKQYGWRDIISLKVNDLSMVGSISCS